MAAIIRKELADYFNSVRFPILFILVIATAGYGLVTAYNGIRAALLESGAVTGHGFVFLALFTSGEGLFTFRFFIMLLIPIIGIALGFDAINSERQGGTLSRLLSQPVYRDSVINGKFLAGLITLTLMVLTTMLLLAGYGIRMIGVPPTAEEIIRLFLYIVVIIIYGAFWMGLSMLFSVIARRVAVSLLIPLAIWLISFLWFFVGPIMFSGMVESAEAQFNLLRISPLFLFFETMDVLLVPVSRGFNFAVSSGLPYAIANPLSLGQSLLTIWPHIVSMISVSIICFAISYVIFMRQEIRAQ
jgi:ABC-2 type transport system permease protein